MIYYMRFQLRFQTGLYIFGMLKIFGLGLGWVASNSFLFV